MNQAPHEKQKNESYKTLSQEQTVDLLSKASKVNLWMTALRRKSELHPHVGASEDESVVVTIRNHRIESVQTRKDMVEMPLADILGRICEAHNDAVDRMEAWEFSQYENISKTLGIDGDFKLPF